MTPRNFCEWTIYSTCAVSWLSLGWTLAIGIRNRRVSMWKTRLLEEEHFYFERLIESGALSLDMARRISFPRHRQLPQDSWLMAHWWKPLKQFEIPLERAYAPFCKPDREAPMAKLASN